MVKIAIFVGCLVIAGAAVGWTVTKPDADVGQWYVCTVFSKTGKKICTKRPMALADAKVLAAGYLPFFPIPFKVIPPGAYSYVTDKQDSEGMP